MIIAVRTTNGREMAVISSITSRIKSKIMKEIGEGDIAEITSGEYKDKRGEVIKIDKVNESAIIKIEDKEVCISLEELKLIEKRSIPIKAIMHTEDIRGYIFIEGDINAIQEAIKNIPHVKGIVGKDITISEIERFIIPEKQAIKIEEGDIVEIISGPFKGEKAKVTRVDELKQEIVVELLDAVIPIPVTISMNVVRIYEKKSKQK